ncbi:uncharacterized protein LOC115880113 [Sitophilus oryzae]|uniref:Uncharacterized protein LOC115880113 n=1 Tax=Sitophilus oryzae TaxID=7048 RepID=A0A6J2XP06_SITOR|nr:uncharacterized protein LOC115880113 [Sitophilus oryzae]
MFPTFGPNLVGIGVDGSVSSRNAPSSRNSRSCEGFCDRAFDCLVYFTRFCGILTAIVLAGVGIDFLYHQRYPGYYIISFSIFVFIAEILWVVTLFLKVSIRADHKIWRIWKYVMLMDDWKKSPFYVLIGLMTLYKPYKLWLVYLAGGLAISLAILHIVTSICQKIHRRKRKRKEHRFGHGDLDSLESSKFEEVTEVLDDGMPEPIAGSSVSLSDSLHTEQDTILEI